MTYFRTKAQEQRFRELEAAYTEDGEREPADFPRTRNEGWGFYGTCATNGHTDPEAAWDEMMAILTQTDGRFRLDPEVARDLLDSTWGRHLANELVGSEFTEVVDTLVADRRWMRSTLQTIQAIVTARADDGR